MIKIENTEVVGWEAAIRGMRNPMNSWAKSDSYDAVDCKACGILDKNGICKKEDRLGVCDNYRCYEVGPNDHDLMMRLAAGGPVHAKYRRMINVYVDITAPLYWWKEFDTYKIGTVANSCSTMHKIQAKEFTLDDFSCEHLLDCCSEELMYVPELKNYQVPLDILRDTIRCLNYYRDEYIRIEKRLRDDDTLTYNGRKHLVSIQKRMWWQMIQLLPSSYNQKRTVMMNYEVLRNIFESRKGHKLDEWHDVCRWIVSLPYSEIITGEPRRVDDYGKK